MSIENKGPGGVSSSYGRRETVNYYDVNTTYDDKVFVDETNTVIGQEGGPAGGGGGGDGFIITNDPGVDPTGVEDATPFVLAALETYGNVIIPKEARILIDNLTMPENTKISGTGTILYKGGAPVSDFTIRLQTDCEISEVSVESAENKSINRVVFWSANCQRPRVSSVKFKGAFRPVDDGLNFERWIHFDQNTKFGEIVNNDMFCGNTGVFCIRNDNCLIKDNRIYDPRIGIVSYGGKYNKVLNNIIVGRNIQYPGDVGFDSYATVTGISFISFGFLGSARGIIGNLISGNTISGVAEESISLDCNGDSATDTPDNPYLTLGTVNSVTTSGSRTTIVLKEAVVGPADWWYDSYINVLTGNAVGATVKILGGSPGTANTATLVISSDGALNIAANDKLHISYGILYNRVVDNHITTANTGIMLWGSAWQNEVTSNHVKAAGMGICVASVASVAGEVSSYSGPNRIHNNTVSMEYEEAPIGSNKGSSADSSPITVGTWAYGTPAITSQNPGLVITDNTIISGKDCKIGGSIFATTAAGTSTVTGAFIQGNRSVGGGSFAVNYTDNVNIGRNYKGLARVDYNVAGSGNNTNLTTMA